MTADQQYTEHANLVYTVFASIMGSPNVARRAITPQTLAAGAHMPAVGRGPPPWLRTRVECEDRKLRRPLQTMWLCEVMLMCTRDQDTPCNAFWGPWDADSHVHGIRTI